MITFNTLNTLIDDIMLESRNNNIAESENLSPIQVEQWIIQYRSFLIKQSIDRGESPDVALIQSISNIPMIQDDSSIVHIDNSRWTEISSVKIPKLVNLKSKDAIISIIDDSGRLIQFTTQLRAEFQGYRRWTSNDYSAYLKNNKLYITGPNKIDYVTINGIFENPSDVPGYETGDEPYPIPASMLPTIKELIMTKEMDIVAVTDNTNDASNDVEKSNLTARDYKKIGRGIK